MEAKTCRKCKSTNRGDNPVFFPLEWGNCARELHWEKSTQENTK